MRWRQERNIVPDRNILSLAEVKAQHVSLRLYIRFHSIRENCLSFCNTFQLGQHNNLKHLIKKIHSFIPQRDYALPLPITHSNFMKHETFRDLVQDLVQTDNILIFRVDVDRRPSDCAHDATGKWKILCSADEIFYFCSML